MTKTLTYKTADYRHVNGNTHVLHLKNSKKSEQYDIM